ncbi:MAG: hypothetical protein JSV44_03575, partial [Candidatus Zixiibacteriota bacterium]
METFLIITGIASLIGGLAIIYYIVRWIVRRPYKKYFNIIWKRSSALKAKNVMGGRATYVRGYRDFYKHRDTDNEIESRIKNGQHALVIGNPLAGKTRAVYQALKRLKKAVDVLIPNLVEFETADFKIPAQFPLKRNRVIVIDDLDKFAVLKNFSHVFQQFGDSEATLIATCRSGDNYDLICKKMETELQIFGKPVEISKIGRDEAIEVAQKSEKTLPKTFDGNIGSIFMPI